MDNSSKALLMAGSILLAIAIVGVGVFLFSSTSSFGNWGAQNIDAVAAQTANMNLRQYAGTRQKGSTVTELMGLVDVYNSNFIFPTSIEVANKKFDSSVLSNDVVTAASNLSPNAYYTVVMSDSNNDSYYDRIQITKNSAGLGEFVGESGDSGEGLLEDLTGYDDENSGDELTSGEEVDLSGENASPSGENVDLSGEETLLSGESEILN